MKTSPAGAPILTGDGLQSVRKRIEAEFAKAKNIGPTSSVPPKPSVPSPDLRTLETAVAPRPRRPLAEIAVPVLRVAERHFENVVYRHPHHQGAYVVTAPTETAYELFAAATEVVDAVCPQEKKAERHEVTTE
jgi:hypothetical protein